MSRLVAVFVLLAGLAGCVTNQHAAITATGQRGELVHQTPNLPVYCQIREGEWRRVMDTDKAGVRVLPASLDFDAVWKGDQGGTSSETDTLERFDWNELMPAIPNADVETWGYALTYPAHQEEARLEEVFFFRKRGPALPMSQPIEYRPQLDYEAEIGILMHRGDEQLGYVMANDLTDRGVQVRLYDPENRAPGFEQAKGFRGALRVGPLLVIGDASTWDSLGIDLSVNGHNRQHVAAKDCLLGPEDFRAEILGGATTNDWVLISTGTSAGVVFSTPSKVRQLGLVLRNGFSTEEAREEFLSQLVFLDAGDQVAMHSETLGRSETSVVARADTAPTGPVPERESAAESVSFASADGTRLHGSLFRAEAPVAGLLLVHGMQSHSGWFEAAGTADAMADAGITCLAYDRRGSGRSDGARGHADGPQDMVNDIDAAYNELKGILQDSGAGSVPVHVLANCYGTRIVLPYAQDHPARFASIVLTAPATDMSRRADYGLLKRLEILLSPRSRYIATPLKDRYFISGGPWLQWIEEDPYALRKVTGGFLISTQKLTKRMNKTAKTLDVPLLVVLGERDMMVNNKAIKNQFIARYAGPVEVLEFDVEHYVDFTNAQPAFAENLKCWILSH